MVNYFCLVLTGLSHSRKPTHPSSSTSGVGVASRRGKRKRPPVEEDEDGDDDAFMEGGGESGGRAVVVEGRERYVNGLLKQLIKVNAVDCEVLWLILENIAVVKFHGWIVLAIRHANVTTFFGYDHRK